MLDYLKDYMTGDAWCDPDSACLNVDLYHKIMAIPQTCTEAINSPESQEWKKAMDKEIKSLKEKNTYAITTLPTGKNVVGGRWVYTIKENTNNTMNYKARYVAKGCSQGLRLP